MSRAGYRALLDGGVRIFEWNGVMIHAKTAVADGRWARVGSTNANITSWFGNWELDVAIEDDNFGAEMQAMFERDLENSTEVVLKSSKLRALSDVRRVGGRGVERRRAPRIEEWRARGRSTRRAAAAGAIRMGRTLGAAITKRREVGAAEAYNLFWSSLSFLGLGLLFLKYPKTIALPVGVLAVWFAVAGLFQAWRLYVRDTTREAADKTEVTSEDVAPRSRRRA
jgi:cardiolipin synthase